MKVVACEEERGMMAGTVDKGDGRINVRVDEGKQKETETVKQDY